jgi:hypothetical protein
MRLSSPSVVRHILATRWEDSESCYPKDGAYISLRNIDFLARATRRHIPNDSILQTQVLLGADRRRVAAMTMEETGPKLGIFV